MMNQTAFPTTPVEVAVLTIQEFTFDLDELDGYRVPPLERVCRTFMADANRALVWWIRFQAYKNWCAKTEVTALLMSDACCLRHACEVAAAFPLNDLWEFDADAFASEVRALAARRADRAVINE
jgi:hypothetical protein